MGKARPFANKKRVSASGNILVNIHLTDPNSLAANGLAFSIR